MLSYIYKGGLLNTARTTSYGVRAHFNKWGVFEYAATILKKFGLSGARVSTVTGDTTLLAEDSGTSIFVNSTTSRVLSLPAASKGVMRFRLGVYDVTSTGLGHGFDPVSTDKIVHLGVEGGAGKILSCLAASDAKGNWATIVSDGVSKWFVTDFGGTWGLEA